MSRRETAVVAMSGGVDSTVAAALLAREGYEVVGIFMRSGVHSGSEADPNRRSCCSAEDALDARMAADKLGIAFHVVNFEDEFNRLIDYFCEEYLRGRTPNPCIVCNRDLKFGRLLRFADALDAKIVATGHYARVEDPAATGSASSAAAPGEDTSAAPDATVARYRLLKGVDASKDQSYVLFPLSQAVLARARFPLGGMLKKDVRALAAELGLPVHDKPDSQEICFVPDDDYRTIMRERCADRLPPPGGIIDAAGKWLGRHNGIHEYTIGQRHKLGIATGEPVYVTKIDAGTNTITVGRADEVACGGLKASEVNWVSIAEPERGTVLRAQIKIRYMHAPAGASVSCEEGDRVSVAFDVPQRAITPGQAVVFYDDDVLLGGGWIDAATGAGATP
ncbi:MAG: tRNA 2-thiouridine(34) synthase MnmA [Planctomycetota bacterium]|nr:tRNA 2-thiouridine(34) synthase MnmA [Planctomycetota bacterium]